MGNAESEVTRPVCLPRNCDIVLMKSFYSSQEQMSLRAHGRHANKTTLVSPPAGSLPAGPLLGWGQGAFQSSASTQRGVRGPWGLARPQSSSRVSEKSGQPLSRRWQGFHFHTVWLPRPPSGKSLLSAPSRQHSVGESWCGVQTEGLNEWGGVRG